MIAAESEAAPEAVRDFLDSRHGRHFADDVASVLAKAGPENIEEAVEAAIARWQGWRISRTISRETGIPQGLPYLTGFANHYAIMPSVPTDRRPSRHCRAPTGMRGSGS